VGFYLWILGKLLQIDVFLPSRSVVNRLGHSTVSVIFHANHSRHPGFGVFWYGWYGLFSPTKSGTRFLSKPPAHRSMLHMKSTIVLDHYAGTGIDELIAGQEMMLGMILRTTRDSSNC
jgi:hypothetical protein